MSAESVLFLPGPYSPSSKRRRRARFAILFTLAFILSACRTEKVAHPLPRDLGFDEEDEPGVFHDDQDFVGGGKPTPPSAAIPQPPLISKVTLSASSVCPGDSVKVDVTTSRRATVVIDSMPAHSRYVQILAPLEGVHPIHVDAMERVTDGRARVETRTTTVTVKDCGSALVRPELVVTQSLAVSHAAKFTVTNSEALGPATYTWDFGDGTTETTNVPAVDHYYSLARLRYQTLFHATVTARPHARTGGTTSTTKSLLITMPQVLAMLTRGVVQPFLSRGFVENDLTWAGLYNHTNDDISFTSFSYQWVMCDTGQDPTPTYTDAVAWTLHARAYEAQTVPLTKVPAGWSADLSSLRAFGVCGVEGTLYGRTARGAPVEAPISVELQRPKHLTRKVVDGDLNVTLQSLLDRGEFGADQAISYETLDRLRREKRIPYRVTNRRADSSMLLESTGASSLALLQSSAERECIPGSAEQPPAPGFTCQATDEFLEDLPYLANAFAGDLVESAACGTVGSMLRAVNPAQFYTHVGIMTSHNDRIRHSTAETARIGDHLKGTFGSDGAEPSVLRFARPGVIGQTLYEAYDGSFWEDDEYQGAVYETSGFNADAVRCDTGENLTAPLVVTGAPSHLEARKRIADRASELNGHYRFFAYTDGAIGLDAGYNQPGKDDLRATVCSTFIWTAAKLAGFEALEGSVLEPNDVKIGAFRDSSTPDGLYFYGSEERRAAAQRLYSAIYAKAQAKGLGPRGKVDLDGADNLANQVTNCFASDSCTTSAKDSRAWGSPGVGRTVSPDNLLAWDGPLYGTTKSLAFRDGQFRRRHVWRAPSGTGALTGTVVTSSGSAAAQAEVVVTGLGLGAKASSSGRFSFPAVRGGCSQVVASQLVAGQLVRGEARACIRPGATTNVRITLANPLQKNRQVLVTGTLRIHDDEVFGSENKTVDVTTVGNVRPSAPSERETLPSACAGGEVAVRSAYLDFKLKDDGSVDVKLAAKLFEGTSCDTRDQEDSDWTWVSVPRDAQARLSLKLKSTGAGGGDYASFDLEVSNLPDT